jgi:hypothetical protein
MPKNIFKAIAPSITHLLGGAKVSLSAQQIHAGGIEDTEGMVVRKVKIGGVDYFFNAIRSQIGFTKTEQRFLKELLTSLRALLEGFSDQSYASHFRTALLTSLMDIS